MRVAIDARCLSERYTSNRTYWSELVAALGRRDDLELLLVSNDPIPAEDVPPNAEVALQKASGRWFSLVTLPTIARRWSADLGHVQYSVSPFFRMPVVTMVHDVSFFLEPSWFGLKDRTLLRKTVPAACRRAARVVVPSETCRRELLQFIPVSEDKVIATPLGVSNGLLKARPKSATLLNKPYVLLVGGWSPRKNLAGAIAAVKKVRETVPEMGLVVTGRVSEPLLEPWIVTPGPVEEDVLVAAYRGAHALLHPSYHEGFGLTVLEAMALGCPVVASNCGAIPEVAGDAAILCDPKDAVGMAEGLVRLLDGEFRKRMVDFGNVRAATFTWDRTAALTVEAYRQALIAG